MLNLESTVVSGNTEGTDGTVGTDKRTDKHSTDDVWMTVESTT